MVEDSVSEINIDALVSRLRGMPIWFVNAGGAASTSFSLSLGSKKARTVPLKNPSVPQEFREFEGEATLYVWCTWRLESKDAVASSDQEPEQFLALLMGLVGRTVTATEVVGRFSDLVLEAGEYRLQVFCDHVPPEPSSELNWELVASPGSAAVGPGFEIEVSEV